MEKALKLLEAELGAEVVYEGPEPPPPEWWAEQEPGLIIEVEGSSDPPDEEEPPPNEGRSLAKRSTSSPETVAQPTDRKSRRVSVGDWRRALTKADELRPIERLVAFVLAEFMDNDGGGAWPRQSTLAAACGLKDTETVSKALRAIEAAGYLHIQPRPGFSSVYLATVPEGGKVIHHPGLTTPPVPEGDTPPVPEGDTSPVPPGTTQPSTQPSTQRPPASLTEDQELYQAMLYLAEHTPDVRQPKSWIPGVFADDIAPIIDQQGRDAGLAEIQRRIAKTQRRQKRRTHHRPPETDHGSEVAAVEGW